MHFGAALIALNVLSFAWGAEAQTAPLATPAKNQTPVEVTADESLEWYQDKRLYVARGKAKAVHGEMVVEADLLTAHERDKPKSDAPKVTKTQSGDKGTGDIDLLTAEQNVRITSPGKRVSGDRAVYNLDQQSALVTGQNLKYETESETVTARDSLEYWEGRKMAVARGNAVAKKEGRHVEADVLSAEFRDMPNGSTQLAKMSADGNVTVITKGNVVRGDKGVYDITRDIAVLTGHVRITRDDGTQLSGDVGEVDFKSGQSRLMNDGSGRVRALLAPKQTEKAATPVKAVP